MLISTHILPEVSALCERVIIIHQGRVVAQDRIENLSSALAASRSLKLRIDGPADRILSGLRSLAKAQNVTLKDPHYIVEYLPGNEPQSEIMSLVLAS